MTEASIAIALRGISKTYTAKGRPSTLALDDISLNIVEGEFVALVGPSGCGKSTLLKLISGLLPPTSGNIEVFKAAVTRPLPSVGIVFQSPVLMKWRTIFENVILPLEIMGMTDKDSRDRVMNLLELAGIRDFANSYPKELSGGMQQRASICRALVHNPPLLLLDEPFGALDALTRSQMNMDLARILAQTKKTTVLITHSVSEAVFLADRVVVMSARPGRITEVVEVKIPHPRTVSVRREPRFNELVQQIGMHIGFEFT